MFDNILDALPIASFIGALLYRAHAAQQGTEELIFSSFIIRHGARGPTRKALYLSVGETSAQRKKRNKPNSEEHPAHGDVSALWAVDELDALTSVGADQLVSVGIFFANYLRQHPELLTSSSCAAPTKMKMKMKLRRSERPRVIASSKSFIQGYNHEIAAGSSSRRVELQYEPHASLAENVAVFRSWTGTEYNKDIAEMKSSELYQKKGEEMGFMLDATVGKACGPWAQHMSRAGQLNLTTYLHEVLGCEEYSPNPKQRGQGSLTEMFHRNNDDTTTTCNNTMKDIVKDTNIDSREGLRQLARWSFDQRFINRSTMGEKWGMTIGGDLLREIEGDFETSNANPNAMMKKGGNAGHNVSVYVGHDYTILALMAALGIQKHPPDIMGFGAFAIMEYRRHTRTGAIRQCLLLQTTPFPDATCPSKMTIESPVHVFEQIV
jgi:hypothetical protein